MLNWSNSLPLSYARASRKHVIDDFCGDGPLQPFHGRGQHKSHPLGFETSRSHKQGNACVRQTPICVSGGSGCCCQRWSSAVVFQGSHGCCLYRRFGLLPFSGFWVVFVVLEIRVVVVVV